MMILHGVTKKDLISAYIQRFHNTDSILVIHKNDSEGYTRIMKSVEEDLEFPVPHKLELNSEFIFLGVSKRAGIEFISRNNHLVCDTTIELYVNGSRYLRN